MTKIPLNMLWFPRTIGVMDKPQMYSAEDFAILRASMRDLPRGELLFIVNRHLEPEQMKILGEGQGFLIIAGQPNGGGENFYCIARKRDKKLAFKTVEDLVKIMGVTNISPISRIS